MLAACVIGISPRSKSANAFVVTCPPRGATISDIALPVHCSAELQSVEWLDGAEGLAVGARFRGRNRNDLMGEWETVSEVAEVDDQRRWVWNVLVDDQISTTWGFEVEPATDGVLIRQWGRLGTGPSGLMIPIAAQPDKEARIIERRLAQWRQGMAANLEWIRTQVEG